MTDVVRDIEELMTKHGLAKDAHGARALIAGFIDVMRRVGPSDTPAVEKANLEAIRYLRGTYLGARKAVNGYRH